MSQFVTRSARATLGALPGGDKNAHRRAVDIGGMPDTRRIYRVLASRQRGADLAPVDLLNQRHRAFDADDHFVPERVHFPTAPVFGEMETGDQATFRTVRRMA